MKKYTPIKLVVHYPQTEKGKRELEKRVAFVHSEAISRFINKFNCPASQKIELLDLILEPYKSG